MLKKIKIAQAFDTPTHAFPGDAVGRTIEVPEELAREWVQAGYATAVDKIDLPEPAEVATPEASKPKATTAETRALERLSKVELLSALAQKGVEASESNTKSELIELLKS